MRTCLISTLVFSFLESHSVPLRARKFCIGVKLINMTASSRIASSEPRVYRNILKKRFRPNGYMNFLQM